jgi:hypothetical protein
MELKDFISETLNQIVEGIVVAQKFGEERGALVNPNGLIGLKEKADYWDKATGEAASRVEFDVAITAIEGKGTKGGVGVFAGAIGLGSQGQSDSSKTTASHVKFSVPVHFPKSRALKEFKPQKKDEVLFAGR